MNISPLEYFTDNLKKHQVLLINIKKKIRFTSMLRLTVFVATIIAIYLSTTISLIALNISVFIGLAIFILLIKRHLDLYKQKRWYEALIKVNADEISILNMEVNAEYSGKEFIDDNHPFSSDLDLFGKKSIFRLINRTATLSGKKQLANQLTSPNKDEELILKRQEAIADLINKNNWRQEFQATGIINPENPDDVIGLINWANQKGLSFKIGRAHV